MKLLQVIPIARGISYEVLSYFTVKSVPVGSLVEIELRKKKVKGIVVSSEEAEDVKAKIRSAGFTIKKIEKLGSRQCLSPAFVRACTRAAEFHAATTGAVLSVAVPQKILQDEKSRK
jgi:primosomal protein N'